MPGINEGKRRRKQRKVNSIQNDASIVIIALLAFCWLLKKVCRKVDILAAEMNDELESSHKLKILSVRTVIDGPCISWN